MSSISYPIQVVTKYPGLAGKTWHAHKRDKAGAAKLVVKQINSVDRLLKSTPALPQRPILLGVTEGAEPLLLELNASSTGAILISCEAGYGKTHQLQVITESVLSEHFRQNRRVVIIGNQPWEWQSQVEQHQRQGVRITNMDWLSPGTAELIRGLVELAQIRLVDERPMRDILLVLDELENLSSLDQQTRVYLQYLITCGPMAHIWPVASLTVGKPSSQGVDSTLFKTHIYGHYTKNASTKDELAGFQMRTLDPGQFAIKWNGNWIKYRLPMIGR